MSGTTHPSPPLQPVVDSLRALQKARAKGDSDEVTQFVEPLRDVIPEAEVLRDLHDMTAEHRLVLFDKLLGWLEHTNERSDPIRRSALPLITGYLTTVAAGGAPSLGLAEKLSGNWPEITAWSYVIGGLGESVIWSSGFDGLGRLVARDLVRPFRFDEPPTSDISLDEGHMLFDAKLKDPLVHLRIKQARLVSVSLVPGVNILVPINEVTSEDSTKQSTGQQQAFLSSRQLVGEEKFIDRLADAIVQKLESRTSGKVLAKKKRKSSAKKKQSSQGDWVRD